MLYLLLWQQWTIRSQAHEERAYTSISRIWRRCPKSICWKPICASTCCRSSAASRCATRRTTVSFARCSSIHACSRTCTRQTAICDIREPEQIRQRRFPTCNAELVRCAGQTRGGRRGTSTTEERGRRDGPAESQWQRDEWIHGHGSCGRTTTKSCTSKVAHITHRRLWLQPRLRERTSCRRRTSPQSSR